MSKHRVAGTEDLAPGGGMPVIAGGKQIALFNVGGTYHAIGNICSHWGGALGDGSLHGETVVCPYHGAQFNVCTGRVVAPPAKEGVPVYPVTVEADEVFVEVE